MVKVKPIKTYYDTELKKELSPDNETFEVSEERAKLLVRMKVCEEVKGTTKQSNTNKQAVEK